MKVIRCSHCNELMSSKANICTYCGTSLSDASDATAPTIVRPRQRSRKIPHVYPAGCGEKTVSMDNMSTADAGTVKVGERSPSSPKMSTMARPQTVSDEVESIDDRRRGTNWQKIVESRATRRPATSAKTPRELESLLIPKGKRGHVFRLGKKNVPPSMFFWIGMLLMAGLVMGGLFGIVVALGRGILQSPPPHHNQLSVQITPSDASLGTLLTLRGSNFSPNGRIGLTRDRNIPMIDTGGQSILLANSKGNFVDTVIVDSTWLDGSHLVRAEDAILHKMASFTVTVIGHGSSLRPAHLLLSTNAIDFGSGDQATNSTKVITLTDAGGGEISWQSIATQTWLTLTPQSGTFSGGQSVQVTVAADRSNLVPGSYTAEVIFSSNVGHFTLPVKMTTTLLQPGYEAALQLSPAVLSFTGTDGGVSPGARIVTVSNPGALPLQWRASTPATNTWLAISPPSGHIPEGGSQPVTISVNTSTLLPGTYSASVTFQGWETNPVKHSPQTFSINLTVLPQCAFQVSPGSLAFSSVYLQPVPATKMISLNASQSCSKPLSWSASVATNNGGQWLNLHTTSGTTPSSLSISVNPIGLNPGVYTGGVIFSSSAGTQTVPVTFTIGQEASCTISVTPVALTFTGVTGQSNPARQVATIAASGTCGHMLIWTATTTGAWLTTTPTSGTLSPNGSSSTKVGVVLTGLSPSTYQGTVTITAIDSVTQQPIGSPQNITVALTVQPHVHYKQPL